MLSHFPTKTLSFKLALQNKFRIPISFYNIDLELNVAIHFPKSCLWEQLSAHYREDWYVNTLANPEDLLVLNKCWDKLLWLSLVISVVFQGLSVDREKWMLGQSWPVTES